ncbi:MAG TPA: hypothetical protein VGU68_11230, partial [Ktedonobacteraceae bacterium]|nr:hypothetical protein [Ktedonobacteraceae bacterium]
CCPDWAAWEGRLGTGEIDSTLPTRVVLAFLSFYAGWPLFACEKGKSYEARVDMPVCLLSSVCTFFLFG